MRLSFDNEVGIEFEATTCPNCGITFGAPPGFMGQRRRLGGNFYCPNGHVLHFGKSELDQLKEKLDLQKKQTDQAQKALAREQTLREQASASATYHRNRAEQLDADLDKAKKSARAQKAASTRLKNRVAHGVCPCCNRTFQNLQRHMSSQHPEFQNNE